MNPAGIHLVTVSRKINQTQISLLKCSDAAFSNSMTLGWTYETDYRKLMISGKSKRHAYRCYCTILSCSRNILRIRSIHNSHRVQWCQLLRIFLARRHRRKYGQLLRLHRQEDKAHVEVNFQGKSGELQSTSCCFLFVVTAETRADSDAKHTRRHANTNICQKEIHGQKQGLISPADNDDELTMKANWTLSISVFYLHLNVRQSCSSPDILSVPTSRTQCSKNVLNRESFCQLSSWEILLTHIQRRYLSLGRPGPLRNATGSANRTHRSRALLRFGWWTDCRQVFRKPSLETGRSRSLSTLCRGSWLCALMRQRSINRYWRRPEVVKVEGQIVFGKLLWAWDSDMVASRRDNLDCSS